MSPKTTRRSIAERFWSKVAGGDVTTCWTWTGASNPRTGYGTFSVAKGRFVLAHRFAYESLVDKIPPGLHLDHLCRVRACVNPWHLEPVTPQVNVHRCESPFGQNARKTHCVNRHEFTEDNIYRPPGAPTKRMCVTCHRERSRKYRAARRQVASPATFGGAA